MSRCLLCVLLLFAPVLVYGQPGPDYLVLNECLDESTIIGSIPKACISGTISRCDSFNVSLRVTVGTSINQTINISRGGSMDPAIGFSIPSQLCSNNAHATLHFDPSYWKLTPSSVQFHPKIHFDTPCTVSRLGVSENFNVPDIQRTFNVGADCSTAKSCSACAGWTEPGGAHPCGWCQSTSTCFASNAQNQPYCMEPCPSNKLLRSNAQCTEAAQAQSTSDSAWSPEKKATVIVLAILLPILVIVIALCLRRSYNRHRAKQGTTSGVGIIQAHVQGYRPTSESVSTEVSTNTSVNASNAEFRQLEGYNPPSARATSDSHV